MFCMDKGYIRCWTCNGIKEIRTGGMMTRLCHICNGEGKIINPEYKQKQQAVDEVMKVSNTLSRADAEKIVEDTWNKTDIEAVKTDDQKIIKRRRERTEAS